MKEDSTTTPRSQYTAKRLPYEGPTPRWEWPGLCKGPYKNKKRGLGSYDASVISGLNRYKSPMALYMEIRGEIPKPGARYPQDAQLGLLMEPVIAEMYRLQTRRVLIDRADYPKKGGRWDVRASLEHEWMIANLDMEVEALGKEAVGLQCDGVLGNGILEMKHKLPWADFFDDQGDPLLEVQVQHQHQLMTTGLEWGSIAVVMGFKFYYVDMRAHERMQNFLFNAEKEFWERCWNGDPPPIDWHQSTAEAIEAKFPVEMKKRWVELPDHIAELFPRYFLLEDAIKDAKKEQDEIANRVKFQLSDAEEGRAQDGTKLVTWKKSKDGAGYWAIPEGVSISEEDTIKNMGGKHRQGKKGGRQFRPKR